MPNSQLEDIQARFAEFHRSNPIVYQKLVQYARQAKAAGHGKIGIKLLLERFRWFALVETNDQHGYKINNDYSSRYARLIAEQEPDLAEMFNFRELARLG